MTKPPLTLPAISSSTSSHLKTLFSLLAVCSVLTGCVTLTPQAELEARIPPQNYLEVDGRSIYVEQSGHGESLLLLHGFGASTYAFRDVVPLLGECFRLTALDLTGFGYTERPERKEAYSAAAQVEVIVQVMDQLGIRRTSVLGHSYGGSIGLLLAQQHPERVDRLVLISPATQFDESPKILKTKVAQKLGYQLVKCQLSRPGKFRRTLRNAFYQNNKLSKDEAEEYRERLLVEGLRDTYYAFVDLSVNHQGIGLELEHVRKPILILASRKDEVIDFETIQEAKQALPNATMVVLENVGHSAAEEEPERVAQEVIRFLR